jgi:hypothetical protein
MPAQGPTGLNVLLSGGIRTLADRRLKRLEIVQGLL